MGEDKGRDVMCRFIGSNQFWAPGGVECLDQSRDWKVGGTGSGACLGRRAPARVGLHQWDFEEHQEACVARQRK